jgi:hypothetical protein
MIRKEESLLYPGQPVESMYIEDSTNNIAAYSFFFKEFLLVDFYKNVVKFNVNVAYKMLKDTYYLSMQYGIINNLNLQIVLGDDNIFEINKKINDDSQIFYFNFPFDSDKDKSDLFKSIIDDGDLNDEKKDADINEENKEKKDADINEENKEKKDIDINEWDSFKFSNFLMMNDKVKDEEVVEALMYEDNENEKKDADINEENKEKKDMDENEWNSFKFSNFLMMNDKVKDEEVVEALMYEDNENEKKDIDENEKKDIDENEKKDIDENEKKDRNPPRARIMELNGEINGLWLCKKGPCFLE